MRTKKEKRYVYKSTLSKVYGLTPSMIAELGEPDEYCDNPHWKSGPFLASLYLVERVEAWIEVNRDRLEKAKASRVKRSGAMRALHAKRRAERWEKAKAWVMTVPISVDPFADTFLERARKYKKFTRAKGLQSFVRHQLTNYEEVLRQLNESEFSSELYPLLRQRVDAAVAAALDGWKATLKNDEPGIAELLHEAEAREEPPPTTWQEYLARYAFRGPVAEAMAKVLLDPQQAHPSWFRRAKSAVERAVAQGRITDLSGLTYECIREALANQAA